MKKERMLFGIFVLAGILVTVFFSTNCRTEQTNSEIKNYFPLAAGNQWTYIRFVYRHNDIFNYTDQIVESSEKNGPPQGTVIFTIARGGLIEKIPRISQETYRIINRLNKTSWSVNVQGHNPRDGRYFPQFQEKKSLDLRWGYINNSVWEVMNGEYLGAKTKNITLLVSLKPNYIISFFPKKGTLPNWQVASIIFKGSTTVPAGKFSNLLVNFTLVKGKSLSSFLSGKKEETFSETKNFGCFLTVSYYAKNIGLVKEIQYNSKMQISYILKLRSFQIRQ